MRCQTSDSSWTDKNNKRPEQNKVLVVVGPSGVGKDILMQKLFDKYPNVFKKGVIHTTKKIRKGEKEDIIITMSQKKNFLN